jgi:uncharacterized Zn-binding protein involved in type VI secretion
MGKPAARMGDPTAHGGVIMMGFPMVLIGGMPAARMGDMHVCPMLTPGLPPIPHVGGPVMLGSPMVLIGGMPAARMGDMAMCVGPPSTILMGCPTVLIGEGGSGSASGGGGGSAAAAAAAAGAATAKGSAGESFSKIEHWVEFQFTDKAGNPVSGLPYKFTDPDSKESLGILRPDGRVARDGMKKGNCKVVLMSVYDAKWSKSTAKVGDTVKLAAKTEGFENGIPATLQIYKRDLTGPDVVIKEIEVKVQSDKVENEWVYTLSTDDKKTAGEEQYSSPEYYFEVLVKNFKARSGLLYLEDYIEIELRDENGKPRANEEYILFLPDGSVRKGKLDGSGKKKEEKVPSGSYSVKFPNLPSVKGK